MFSVTFDKYHELGTYETFEEVEELLLQLYKKHHTIHGYARILNNLRVNGAKLHPMQLGSILGRHYF